MLEEGGEDGGTLGGGIQHILREYCLVPFFSIPLVFVVLLDPSFSCLLSFPFAFWLVSFLVSFCCRLH